MTILWVGAHEKVKKMATVTRAIMDPAVVLRQFVWGSVRSQNERCQFQLDQLLGNQFTTLYDDIKTIMWAAGCLEIASSMLFEIVSRMCCRGPVEKKHICSGIEKWKSENHKLFSLIFECRLPSNGKTDSISRWTINAMKNNPEY